MIGVRVRCFTRGVPERQRVSVKSDRHRPPVLELAEEDLVGQRVADFALDGARERAGATAGR